MHILAAWCGLTIGLSLNIVPPGWQRSLGPLHEAFISEDGWSRPNEQRCDALGTGGERFLVLPIGWVDHAV